MERNLLTPMQEIKAGTLSNDNAFAELQRRKDDFNNNAQLLDDLRLRGKKIFDSALGIDLVDARNRGIPIVILLRNTMLAIGELYRENDSRSKELSTSSTSTLENKVRSTKNGHEQPAVPSMSDPAGAMQQASKSTPAGKHGHIASNSQQDLEETAPKGPASDSAVLPEPNEDPEATEADDSSSDYDGKGPKRKRVAEKERVDASVEHGQNKKRRTSLVSETPENDTRRRLCENERAVGQSAAANGVGEESQRALNTASRQPAGAETQGSHAVKHMIPKTQLNRPSIASLYPLTPHSATASLSVTTPQPPLSCNPAATSQPATAPSPTAPPSMTSNHFLTYQRRRHIQY